MNWDAISTLISQGWLTLMLTLVTRYISLIEVSNAYEAKILRVYKKEKKKSVNRSIIDYTREKCKWFSQLPPYTAHSTQHTSRINWNKIHFLNIISTSRRTTLLTFHVFRREWGRSDLRVEFSDSVGLLEVRAYLYWGMDSFVLISVIFLNCTFKDVGNAGRWAVPKLS